MLDTADPKLNGESFTAGDEYALQSVSVVMFREAMGDEEEA